ncbi:MAG: FAD-dependent oxidoreductase [Synergistaceae bacterium]|nr:FAD-dependent oxidoreductase [Synergistaceae bacterium]
MKHVIIGAGAAGLTAAKTIRALKPQDEIIVISEDEQVVSRCMLHKYISGERSAEALSFVPEGFFDANRIEWRGGLKVTGVGTSARAVLCGNGTIGYDKLLVATGAISAVPPIGSLRSAKNVFGLRHLSDAKAIREAALRSQKVVVIGGGLVGLDAVYALLEMKKDVTVVELEPRILAINLDERAAGAYQSRFEAADCKFRLGYKVTGTAEDSEGNVTQVLLDDGSGLPCDLVVVATGVRSAVGFLEGSEIVCPRAITVDQYMATSCPDVYAAGDVTGLSGTWPNAMRQGETAARNMCGSEKIYEDTFAAKNTMNFFGLVTLSVGALKPEEGDVVKQREDRRVYQKVILRDGRAVGVVLQGDISNSGFWQYFIKNGTRIDAMNKPVWKLSFADFCALDETGGYRWAVTG